MAMEPGLMGEAKLERGHRIVKMEAEQFGEQAGDAEHLWAIFLYSQGCLVGLRRLGKLSVPRGSSAILFLEARTQRICLRDEEMIL